MYFARLAGGVISLIGAMRALRLPVILLLSLVLVTARSARSQSARVDPAPSISGVLFADYEYTLTSPDAVMEGQNGFGYRRVYLTIDYPMSERLSGRLRFEAKDNSTNEDGLPAPFVKDLYLRKRDFPATGHSVTLGVHPTPNFRLSEDVWGYRSLEKTIQDRAGVVGSRDMGISATGPVGSSGALTYRIMFANNSGIRSETDKYKRVYGVLEYRAESILRVGAGSDYYQLPQRTSLNVFGFVGAVADSWSLGVEGFADMFDEDVPGADATIRGISLFGSLASGDSGTLIARFDVDGVDSTAYMTKNTYAIAGYAYRLDDGIEIIPNVIYDVPDGADDPMILVRLTVSATF